MALYGSRPRKKRGLRPRFQSRMNTQKPAPFTKGRVCLMFPEIVYFFTSTLTISASCPAIKPEEGIMHVTNKYPSARL